MHLTKKESFAIQISNYLKNGQYQQACALAEKMMMKFPKEPLSHFMAAKSHYFSGAYKKASLHGFRAYNLSHSKEDMLASAIVTASALFMLNQYEKGIRLLLPLRKEKNEEVKKLLLIFSMVKEHGDDSARYFRELHDLNRKVARQFMTSLAKGRKKE